MWAHLSLPVNVHASVSMYGCVWSELTVSLSVQVWRVRAQVRPILLEGWEGSSPRCDNLLKAVTLNKGAFPCHWRKLIHHNTCCTIQTDRQTSRETDRQTSLSLWRRHVMPAVNGSAYLWSWHVHVVPELLAPPHWRAVLKMTHIYPLNLRTIDWRIRPDTVSDAGWGWVLMRVR